MKRTGIFLIFTILFTAKLFSQVPSFAEKIRIPLWAEIDAFPGQEVSDESDSQYSYAVKQIRETAPFLIEGMVYGWDFSYTPSDREREVSEYFEIVPKQDFSLRERRLVYSSPMIEDNKLYCWCEYERVAGEIVEFEAWNTVQNPRIHGEGYGALEKGSEGFKDAVGDAVRNAVREYYRGFIKNKPKEITGSVLIREQPVIGIDAGRYFIKLDFFLECGRIIQYTQY